jgi:hypothetical protein
MNTSRHRHFEHVRENPWSHRAFIYCQGKTISEEISFLLLLLHCFSWDSPLEQHRYSGQWTLVFIPFSISSSRHVDRVWRREDR